MGQDRVAAGGERELKTSVCSKTKMNFTAGIEYDTWIVSRQEFSSKYIRQIVGWSGNHDLGQISSVRA